MTTLSQARSTPRWQTYAVYVVMALLTLAFLMTGFFKVSGNPMMVANFTHWGYPTWFMYVTGLIELASVVLMWIPRTRFWGALALVGVMLGAHLTHILNSEWSMLPVVFVLLVLSAIVAWTNRPRQA